jgi:DNA-binding transcriptional LysR family regulator
VPRSTPFQAEAAQEPFGAGLAPVSNATVANDERSWFSLFPWNGESTAHYMATTTLAAADLNLLVTLDALLTERSVSRAALRLSLTQSAVSRALSRLRATFGDELFVRTGHGMRPTRLALELAAPLRRTLGALEGLLTSAVAFAPRAAERRFRVSGVDYAVLTLVAPLARRLEALAPKVDLYVQPLSTTPERELETGDLDLLLAPRQAAGASIVWTTVHDDHYVGVVWREHRSTRLTTKDYASAAHVLVSPWGRPGGIVDDVLAARGLLRRVAIQVPSFSLLPDVLVGTQRVATVPERMARRLCELHPLRAAELPVEIPSFTMCMGWHEVHRNDPAHQWLRAEVLESARLDSAQPTASRRRRSRKT